MDINFAIAPPPCHKNEDCGWLNYCLKTKCYHEPLFPAEPLEIISWVALVVLVGFASVGGSGGGQSKVPILVIMLNYTQQTATFITYPILVGAAVVNWFLLIPHRLPNATVEKPLIDYTVALIISAPLIFGAQLGTLINEVAPQFITSMCLIVIISGLLPFMWNNVIKARNEERARVNAQNVPAQSKTPIAEGLLANEIGLPIKNEEAATNRVQDHDPARVFVEPDIPKTDQVVELQALPVHTDDHSKIAVSDSVPKEGSRAGKFTGTNHFEDSRYAPMEPEEAKRRFDQFFKDDSYYIHPLKFIGVCFIFGVLELLSLVRGSNTGKSWSGIHSCTKDYQVVLAMMGVATVAFFLLMRYLLIQEHIMKVRCGYPIEKDEFIMTDWNYLIVFGTGMISGLLTGALGVGTGIVVVPGLLIVGINPRVAAATAGFAKIYASVASLIQAKIDNQIDEETIEVYLLLGFASCAIVTSISYYFVKKWNLQFFVVTIVFCLVLLTIFSELAYIIITYKRFGFAYLMKHGQVC